MEKGMLPCRIIVLFVARGRALGLVTHSKNVQYNNLKLIVSDCSLIQ